MTICQESITPRKESPRTDADEHRCNSSVAIPSRRARVNPSCADAEAGSPVHAAQGMREIRANLRVPAGRARVQDARLARRARLSGPDLYRAAAILAGGGEVASVYLRRVQPACGQRK